MFCNLSYIVFCAICNLEFRWFKSLLNSVSTERQVNYFTLAFLLRCKILTVRSVTPLCFSNLHLVNIYVKTRLSLKLMNSWHSGFLRRIKCDEPEREPLFT